jgi:hypothetical protein
VRHLPQVSCNFPYTTFEHSSAKKDIQQKVNDALLSFQRAVESGFLVKERCIVLTQTIPKVNKIYAEELEELAQLVNVTAKDAPDLLRKMAA